MKVALLGDIALFGENTICVGTYIERFSLIKEILAKCDYVVGNLETPLTYCKKTIGGKSAYLKGVPEDVEILKYLGVTHVTLANNHMFDYGKVGLEDTISVLDKNDIAWYGVNGKHAVLQNGINKAVLLGYCCYSTNGKGLGIVNILDPTKIEADIEQIGEALPIVSMHWGEEHVHYPSYDHIEVSRKICQNREIVIHGHHPHVMQGIETINNSIVTYSLGNFCFDDVYTKKSKQPLVKLSSDNKESFVLILEIEKNKVKNYQIVPFSFNCGKYIIDNSLSQKIEEWSDFLMVNKESYMEKRQNDLSFYLNNRKKNRDIKWYIKRLNLESIKMIWSSRNNLKQYNALIKEYIAEQ